jgi:hypothetical protein
MHAFRLTTELHSSKEYNSRQMISMNSELCICVRTLNVLAHIHSHENCHPGLPREKTHFFREVLSGNLLQSI